MSARRIAVWASDVAAAVRGAAAAVSRSPKDAQDECENVSLD
ncbi:hypothetical protein [Paraburkholderia hayleyella]|nr:hypothetical protein [Paraburkholderia hayleyella]